MQDALQSSVFALCALADLSIALFIACALAKYKKKKNLKKLKSNIYAIYFSK